MLLSMLVPAAACGGASEEILLPVGHLDDQRLVVAIYQDDDYFLTDKLKIIDDNETRILEVPRSRPVSVYAKSTFNLVTDGKRVILFSWPPTPPPGRIDLIDIDPEGHEIKLIENVYEVTFNPIFSSVVIQSDLGSECRSGQNKIPLKSQGQSLDCLVTEDYLRYLEVTYVSGNASVEIWEGGDSSVPLKKWELDGSDFDRATGSEVLYAHFLNQHEILIVSSRRDGIDRFGSGSLPIYTEFIVLNTLTDESAAFMMPKQFHIATAPKLLGAVDEKLVFALSKHLLIWDRKNSEWVVTPFAENFPEMESWPFMIAGQSDVFALSKSGSSMSISIEDVGSGTNDH